MAHDKQPLPTRVRRVTGADRGAIATLVVSGPEAAATIAALFRPRFQKQNAGRLEFNRVVFGDWRVSDEAEEELVVCRTKAEEFEIHCHGGPVGIAALVESIEACGVPFEECDKESGGYLAEEPGTSEAEEPAWQIRTKRPLTMALTDRTALILLDQYQGALQHELTRIQAEVDAGNMTLAAERVGKVLDRVPLGKRLTEPWRVALAGPPNVGKSSLINALVGYQRAVVYDQPGTTRDVVSEATAFDGWPVQLSDTAGIRSTHDALEQQGIRQAEEQLQASDLVIWVTAPDCPDDASHAVPPAGALRLLNKSDLLEPAALDAQRTHYDLATSATKRQGLEQLMTAIVTRLVADVPAAGDAVPVDRLDIEMLQQLLAAINAADAAAARRFVARLTA